MPLLPATIRDRSTNHIFSFSPTLIILGESTIPMN